jgi:exoribonuclease R
MPPSTVPAQPEHAALTSEYAHVTAPLRRLADRYTGELCVALCAGEDPPDWVSGALPDLPTTMQRSGQLANRYERAILDLVEAGVLRHRVGDIFHGVVVDIDPKDERRGEVTIQDPAIEASLEGLAKLPLGDELPVRLVAADLASRKVAFESA